MFVVYCTSLVGIDINSDRIEIERSLMTHKTTTSNGLAVWCVMILFEFVYMMGIKQIDLERENTGR